MALQKLGWERELIQFGGNCVYYILKMWLKHMIFPSPPLINNESKIIEYYQELYETNTSFKSIVDKMINTDHHTPLLGEFSIYSPGYN